MPRRTFWSVAALLGLGILAAWLFWGVSDLQATVYDDDQYLERSHPRSLFSYFMALLSEPVVNLWHPLTVFSHDALSVIFGEKSSVHHHTNSILHLVAGVFLYLWLRTFRWTVWACLTVSLLWVVHPIAVEPSAWISGRKDILLSCFVFLSLNLNHFPRFFILKHLVFALAILSKPTAVVLPLLLLIDRWAKTESEQRSLKKTLKQGAAYLPGMLLLLSLTLYFQSVGTQGLREQFSVMERLSRAGWAFTQHLSHIVWPENLHVGYLTPASLSPVFGLVPLLLVLLLGFALVRRKAKPEFIIGLAFFLLFLLPTVGFVRAGNDLVADRYTYLPLVGFFVLLGGCLPRTRHALIPYLGLPIVILLAVLSVRQRTHWQSTKAIFTRTLDVERNHSYALAQLGVIALKENEISEGRAYLEKSLRLEPRQPLAHHSLGNLAEKEGHFERAKDHYLQLDQTWNNQPWVKSHLAILSWNLGQQEEALKFIHEGERLARDTGDKEEFLSLRQKMGFGP